MYLFTFLSIYFLQSHFCVFLIWKGGKTREGMRCEGRTKLRPFSGRKKFTFRISSQILNSEPTNPHLKIVLFSKMKLLGHPTASVSSVVGSELARRSAPTLKKLPLLSRGRRAGLQGDALKAILCSWTLESSQVWCVFITDSAGRGWSSVGQKHTQVQMQPKKIPVLAKARVPVV